MQTTETPSSIPAAPGPGRLFLRSLAGYRIGFLSLDLVAGLTLAAIAIPEQMATARLAGFPPEAGFFAFLAGSSAFALFGDSRFLSCGADSTIAPIFAGGLAALATAGSAGYASLAAALALMVGILLIAGGFFRLGWIADLLSVPVTTGFLAGIAVHIMVSQLPGLLGLAPPSHASVLSEGAFVATHLGNANPASLIIGLGVLAVVAVSERLSARIPGALIGLLCTTLAVTAFGLKSHGVAVVGAFKTGWPSLAMTMPRPDQLASLMPLCLLVAMIVMIQTAATTRSFPSDPDNPPDVDRDYLGVGVGNLLAGIAGAFPVNSSPPRTAIVVATGGRSQITGLAAALFVIVVFVLGGRLLADVPEAALCGVLLFVGLRLIRVNQMAAIYRQSPGEFLLILATWAAMILLPIEQGMIIGVGLSLLQGIWSITRAHAQVFKRIPGTSIWWPATPDIQGETLPDVVVTAFQAPLSFLNAYTCRRDILALIHAAAAPVRLVVLEASAIPAIDFTAAQMLRGLIRECGDRDIIFTIARLESVNAQQAIRRFGIDAVLGPGRLFHSVDEAVRAFAPQNTPG